MARKKQFDENEILQKAVVLFWKQGYHATSIQDLVNHLGINRASLYDTFGDKRQLFDKAFCYYQSTNQLATQEFLESYENVREGLRKLFELALEQSFQDTEQKGCFVVNTTTELVPNDEQIGENLLKNKQAFEKIIYDYLEAGVQKGQISPQKDLATISSLLFTFQNGLKVLTKVDTNKKEWLQKIDTLLSLLD